MLIRALPYFRNRSICIIMDSCFNGNRSGSQVMYYKTIHRNVSLCVGKYKFVLRIFIYTDADK